MNNRLWIEADYFDEFQCKCGDCKRNCCSNFLITISKKDYLRLITAECSIELADKIESAFIDPDYASDERYKIIRKNYLGNCPLLDNDGLCMVQKELGFDMLSTVCRQYPRSMKEVNNTLQASCSNSCEAVVELLLRKEKVNFVVKEKLAKPELIIQNKEDSIALYLMFTQLIQNRSIPLNQRLQKICGYLNKSDKIETDPVNAFLQVANFIRTVSVNSYIYDEFLNKLDSRYSLDENGYLQFKKDEKLFETNVKNWMVYFENVIVNHLYYMNLPYVDERLKKEDCTEGICLLYAIMKIICSLYTIEDSSIGNLSYVISDIFHLVEHSAFYYNAHLLIKNETTLLTF